MQMKLNGEMEDERLISIACGTRPNVVPGAAVAVLAGDWREQAAGGVIPHSFSARRANRVAAAGPLSSVVPRPYILPSTISAP